MTIDWLQISFPWVLKLRDASILDVPVERVTLTRTPDLQLKVHAVGSARPTKERAPAEAGTMAPGHQLTLVTENSEAVTLEAVHITSQGTKTAGETISTRLEGHASSATIALGEGEVHTSVEWLAHVPNRLWRITRGETPVRRNYVEIEIGSGALVHLGSVHRDRIPDGQLVDDPGFLRFHAGEGGLPDEGTRHAVHRSLEFLLGRALAIVGKSTMNRNNELLSASATTAYVAGGSGAAIPPALLHEREFDSVDEVVVGRFVANYLQAAEKYQLNNVVWLVLHGRNAPLGMVAGYLGSAFELLRRQYYAQPENEERSRLLPADRWRQLNKEIGNLFDQLIAADAWKDIATELSGVKSRFGNLNDVSGTKLNLMLLDDLGLEHGDIEKKALLARNDSAHANPLGPDAYEAVLRRCRALHTLVARVMFTMLGVDVEYFDYSSRGHPPRLLTDRQGDRS